MMMASSRSKIASKLFEQLHKKEVQYIHWKSIDHLEAALEGLTDLDVLVSRAHAVECEYVAQKLGFVELQASALRAYPGIKDFVAFDSSINRFIHLHLHYKLIIGDRWTKGVHLPIEHAVLERRVFFEKNNTYIIHPVDELWMCALRMAFKYRKCFSRNRVLNELNDIRKRIDNSSLEKTIEWIDGRFDYSKELLIHVASGDYKKAQIYANRVYASKAKMRRLSMLQFAVTNAVRFSFRIYIEFLRRRMGIHHIGRRKIRNGGLAVAFVGVDGSGKTSAIYRTQNMFKTQLDVRSVFMGGGRSGSSIFRKPFFWLNDILSYLKHNKKNTSVGNGEIKRRGYLHHLFSILLSLDRLRRLKYIHRGRAAGNLVLIDRWPQLQVKSFLDGPKYDKVKSSSLLEKIAMFLERRLYSNLIFYAPDIVFVFKITPSTSVMRKPNDLNIETAKLHLKEIEKIDFDPSQVIEIDGDKEMNEVDSEIWKHIWHYLK